VCVCVCVGTVVVTLHSTLQYSTSVYFLVPGWKYCYWYIC